MARLCIYLCLFFFYFFFIQLCVWSETTGPILTKFSGIGPVFIVVTTWINPIVIYDYEFGLTPSRGDNLISLQNFSENLVKMRVAPG